MKRQTTQASNENSQDTPMKNIYNSKRKLSVTNTNEKTERNNKLMKEVKSENCRKRYVYTVYCLYKLKIVILLCIIAKNIHTTCKWHSNIAYLNNSIFSSLITIQENNFIPNSSRKKFLSASNIPDATTAFTTSIEKRRRKSSFSLTNNSYVSTTIEKEDIIASTKEDENEIKVVSEAETDIIEKYDENCSLNSGTSNPDQEGTYIITTSEIRGSCLYFKSTNYHFR